ncbi:DISP complex protein LRCH3 isoform X5 [Microcaecilia unicolor]|uniref:Leucine-rich repeat and calponin homology domain-containing protein 3 isoform X5 n=1 Tax=Microcaecilia unicolor TaxID=1415580 RepID=A0A6P7Z7N3_9AMPH|nr:leucine-rich repeat and calponin homology domain-containing protein 3 isoform X5 [Microcaecilia unicolor]
MAAVVLLSVEGSGGSSSVLSGVSQAAVGAGPAPGLGPAAWNRSLERALEEAAVTGVLNLSGRKLKDFPRSAANQDLTDTTQADLSRNRLTEIPMEVCHYISLEILNLYQNCMRCIPEAVLNLQALTFLNISRNQLSTLPVHMCSLPLKILIASNNKLISLPEEIGQLRQLTELDVSCNEIQTIPPQIGNLESLRDLNVRRNHLVCLPEELSELPLVRLDFSCNKITTIPVCYRNLRHLQTIILDNNPLQSPPAQICIKGKIHIFKYLNLEACKITPDLPDYDRRPMGFGSCHEELYSSRTYGALDSGFNSVDSGDKRWSGNEPTDEFSDLPLRVAEVTKEQRLRRESQYQENRSNVLITNGAVEHDLDQIDYIDSCTTEEEEEDTRQSKGESLSSEFMAYIEQRRISHENSPAKQTPFRELHRTDETRQYTHQNRYLDEFRRPETLNSLPDRDKQQVSRSHTDRTPVDTSYLLCLAHNPNQQKTAQSPQKQSPLDIENDDRLAMSPASPTLQTVHLSLPNSSLVAPSSGGSPHRPESFLFRAVGRDDGKKDCRTHRICKQQEEEEVEDMELTEQLRKNIELRLKVSLPNDLGAALTDGVVLCHLANHVRPRSVPSIHVPSPAVPKLTMAKCRRNVENFLEACRKIGVPQERLCLPLHILEERGLGQVAVTVQALLELAPPKHHHLTTV